MNKTDLIVKISEVTEVSKKDVKAVIDALPDVIKDTVVAGDKVQLVGFATFSKKHVDAKSGTSKLGGVEKPWSTPEKDVVAVSLGKSYKEIQDWW